MPDDITRVADALERIATALERNSAATATEAPKQSAKTASVAQNGPKDYSKLSDDDPLTDKQLAFIRKLGGDLNEAAKLSKRGAAEFIDQLLDGKARS